MKPLVFGVLNVTPDSFSDGGRHLDPNAAVARGLRLLADGADVLDIGGESTRPSGEIYGAGRRQVSFAEELARVMPVVDALRRATDRPLSIDTRKSRVAVAAIKAGVRYVNDVSGGTFDPELLAVVADSDADLVLMHTRGTPETMAELTSYGDVVSEVCAELLGRVDAALAAGVRRERIWIDPGFGFAKTPAQSRRLLSGLGALVALGLPVLAGASRKSMLGSAHPPESRVPESLAAALWAAQAGARGLRVHDVEPTVRALRLWAEVAGAGVVPSTED